MSNQLVVVLESRIAQVNSEIKEISSRTGIDSSFLDNDIRVTFTEDLDNYTSQSLTELKNLYDIEMFRLKTRLDRDLKCIDELFDGKVLLALFSLVP